MYRIRTTMATIMYMDRKVMVMEHLQVTQTTRDRMVLMEQEILQEHHLEIRTDRDRIVPMEQEHLPEIQMDRCRMVPIEMGVLQETQTAKEDRTVLMEQEILREHHLEIRTDMDRIVPIEQEYLPEIQMDRYRMVPIEMEVLQETQTAREDRTVLMEQEILQEHHLEIRTDRDKIVPMEQEYLPEITDFHHHHSLKQRILILMKMDSLLLDLIIFQMKCLRLQTMLIMFRISQQTVSNQQLIIINPDMLGKEYMLFPFFAVFKKKLHIKKEKKGGNNFA